MLSAKPHRCIFSTIEWGPSIPAKHHRQGFGNIDFNADFFIDHLRGAALCSASFHPPLCNPLAPVREACIVYPALMHALSFAWRTSSSLISSYWQTGWQAAFIPRRSSCHSSPSSTRGRHHRSTSSAVVPLLRCWCDGGCMLPSLTESWLLE